MKKKLKYNLMDLYVWIGSENLFQLPLKCGCGFIGNSEREMDEHFTICDKYQKKIYKIFHK